MIDTTDLARDAALRRATRYLLRRDLPEHLPMLAVTLTFPHIRSFSRAKKDIGCFLSRLQGTLRTRLAAVGIIVRGEVSMHTHMFLVAADLESERTRSIVIADLDKIIKEQWARFNHRSALEARTDAIFSMRGYVTYLTHPRNLDLTGENSYIFWHNPNLLWKLKDLKPRNPKNPTLGVDTMTTKDPIDAVAAKLTLEKGWPNPRLAAALQLRNRTVQWLSNATGWAYPNTHNLSTGKWIPGPDTKRRVCALLDLTENDLWPSPEFTHEEKAA